MIAPAHRAAIAAASALLVAAGATDRAVAQSVPSRKELGSLVLENIPAHDAALVTRLRRYLNARAATFLDWLPDGSILVSTRFGDTAQLHRVAAPLGMREQLTFEDEPIITARAPQTAQAEGFIYLKDVGGNEQSQLRYLQLADRSERLLTDGKSRHGSVAWSNDGKRVAFFGNGRDGVSHDIYMLDLAGAGTTPRLVLGAPRPGAWGPLDWSPDDQKLLVEHQVSVNESYLHVMDAASGALTPLDDSGKKVGIITAKFAPDGRGVYVATDAASEFAQLQYVDLATRESRLLTGDTPWDIEEFDVSADGRYLAWVANQDGVSHLTVLDQMLKLELAPQGVPAGQISNLRFDRTGKRLAFSIETALAPKDVYVYELERNQLVRWTQSEIGPLDARTLAPAQLVRYPTWDRANGKARSIAAFVYRPRTPGPHPVVIDIHGGPESQARPEFDGFTQFLVNELGYAVIQPNVRGSTGYGKTFSQLDNGELREGSVKDIGSLLVWIGLQPGFDRERVVVMGGSYGGYMSLASLAAYGDRLRGGVDVVGISNFVTFLTNTSGYRRDLRRAEYGDERDARMRTFLTRISPLSNTNGIRRPLLVVQGLNDPRVPATESEQMVARIRSHGGEVWYLAAKDEGHGFRKKPNRDFYLATVAMFLERLKR
ncbi:MAG TPA: prolyl oligopeptidase family serine peptidase [Steroidobacteraceae bacterium]|nr:prolyl oligopeptidase family serine peptidase [Steroidobacteraceae bacterium]